MSNTETVSIQLDSDLHDQVSEVASALDRPKSWVIEQAVREFVALQQWHMTAIDEGIRAADAGRVVAHDKVAAWIRSWGQPDELPMPECN